MIKHMVTDGTLYYYLKEGQLRGGKMHPHHGGAHSHIDHMGQLLEFALRAGFTHAWILPGSPLDQMDYDAFAVPDCYDVHQTTHSNNIAYEQPHAARIKLKKGWDQELLIAYPHRENFRWHVEEPLDALYTIEYLEAVYGVPMAWSNGHVSRNLLHRAIKGNERWLKAAVLSEAVPWLDAAQDLNEPFVLFPALRGKRIFTYDRNSSYLAACTGLSTGEGSPEYICQGEIDPIFPGMYHIQLLDSPAAWEDLPHVIPGGWITADLLQFALKEGFRIHIVEAWQWKTSHQTLRRWAEQLFEGRRLLKTTTLYPHETARRNALMSSKEMAVVGAGRFAMANSGQQHRWTEIVQKNRVNMLVAIKKYQQTAKAQKRKLVRVTKDSLSYATIDDNPYNAVKDMKGNSILARRDELGGFKLESSVFLSDEIYQEAAAIQERGGDVWSFLMTKGEKHGRR